MVRVDAMPALEEALQQGGFDVILSNFVFSAFDRLHVLARVQHVCPGVPFIVVSGMLNDTASSRTLTCGAMAYVLKHRLSDLPQSIRRVDGRLPTHQRASCHRSRRGTGLLPGSYQAVKAAICRRAAGCKNRK